MRSSANSRAAFSRFGSTELPQAIPYRALLRQPNGPPRPRASGNQFSSGTNTLSITISPVVEARRLSLFFSFGVVKTPHATFQDEAPDNIIVILGHTTKTSASGAFEIHILAPLQLITTVYLFGASFHAARIGTMIGFGQPERANLYSPLASLGRYFSRWASVP